MTPADLESWLARMGFGHKEAALRLGVSLGAFRNYLHGRRPIPRTVELLCGYVERYGPVVF